MGVVLLSYKINMESSETEQLKLYFRKKPNVLINKIQVFSPPWCLTLCKIFMVKL